MDGLYSDRGSDRRSIVGLGKESQLRAMHLIENSTEFRKASGRGPRGQKRSGGDEIMSQTD